MSLLGTSEMPTAPCAKIRTFGSQMPLDGLNKPRANTDRIHPTQTAYTLACGSNPFSLSFIVTSKKDPKILPSCYLIATLLLPLLPYCYLIVAVLLHYCYLKNPKLLPYCCLKKGLAIIFLTSPNRFNPRLKAVGPTLLFEG